MQNSYPQKQLKIVVIVQARMGSTRLPGKHMKTILGKPMIGFLFERLKRVNLTQSVILATTVNPIDDILVDYCIEQKYEYFRGSEENVLDRYYRCALKYQADAIVRICGDCPLIDPIIIDQVINSFLDKYPDIDYVSNTLERTYPRGMDVEIFSFDSFKRVFRESHKNYELEHVTPYYYQNPNIFKLENLASPENNSQYRLTVDTEEDFKLIHLIFEELYPKNSLFCLNDILDLMKKHPDWVKINEHIHQKLL